MSSPDIIRSRIRFILLSIVLFIVLLVVAAVAAYELIASPFQAMLLADYGKRLTYRLAEGPSDHIHFPEYGPHDIRFGYTRLPDFSQRLTDQGLEITQQARISPEMKKLTEFGLFLPYREKSVAGLTLEDCRGNRLYQLRHPRLSYPDFTSIPPVVANTLLFIENRELLDPNHPQRNPAVEWDRLGQAVLEKAMQTVNPNRNVPGGSTLATQIEKYRHSPDGLTMTASDKLRQMASASVRAYLDGTDTRVTRRRIVLDYLNTVPLAAAPGFGEVHGLGDALDAWFGLDFDQVNRLLQRPEPTPEAARAYKHVLGLLISQRKPSWYLLTGRDGLDEQADIHLRLLTEAGVITPEFRDMALKQHIVFKNPGKNGKMAESSTGYTGKKAANAIRVELSSMLDVPRMYDLDRLDLTVTTTLHAPSQRAIADLLGRLDDPTVVEATGLFGPYLLSPENDLSKVLYSLTLYELTDDGALLRVQADSLNQPFDLNQGAKLDMGSSAKLRTLITYLQIIGELHAQYAGLKPAELAKVKVEDKDVLSRWAVDTLRRNPGMELSAMLHAAMSRSYSADTSEGFFTGGGLLYFANFNKDDDGRVMDLWEATRNSVNLPFIRLMRDIVRHFMYRAPSTANQILRDAENPERRTYLMKFADREGQDFLARFHKKYKGLKPEEATANLINHLSANPRRLAAVYRYLEPKASPADFAEFMRNRLANPGAYDAATLERLYQDYGPEKFNLSDRGYIAQIHPLELWLVAYLRTHPKAGWSEIVKASGQERVEVYDWLFKTGRKNAQDSRIQSLLEIEAFQEIHRRWRRLGYPFSSLVPSYASAIGSSADRPAALAELMGIILNDGRKLPTATINRLEFAAGTPYHTVFKRRKPQAEQIFPAPVAEVVREALVNVVQEGTARRIKGAFATAQGELVIGGKTGTGDHRYETYAPDGSVLASKVMNRVATFAFFIGKRFYGVITTFVPGEQAAHYKFTSGLPVQLLKALSPSIQPLIAGGGAVELTWEQEVRAFEAAHGPQTPPKPVPVPTPALPAASPPAVPRSGTPAIPAAGANAAAGNGGKPTSPPASGAPGTKPAAATPAAAPPARPTVPAANGKPPVHQTPPATNAKPPAPQAVPAAPRPAPPTTKPEPSSNGASGNGGATGAPPAGKPAGPAAAPARESARPGGSNPAATGSAARTPAPAGKALISADGRPGEGEGPSGKEPAKKERKPSAWSSDESTGFNF